MKNLLSNYWNKLDLLLHSEKSSDFIGFIALSSLFTLPFAFIVYAYLLPLFWYVVGLLVNI